MLSTLAEFKKNFFGELLASFNTKESFSWNNIGLCPRVSRTISGWNPGYCKIFAETRPLIYSDFVWFFLWLYFSLYVLNNVAPTGKAPKSIRYFHFVRKSEFLASAVCKSGFSQPLWVCWGKRRSEAISLGECPERITLWYTRYCQRCWLYFPSPTFDLSPDFSSSIRFINSPTKPSTILLSSNAVRLVGYPSVIAMSGWNWIKSRNRRIAFLLRVSVFFEIYLFLAKGGSVSFY